MWHSAISSSNECNLTLIYEINAFRDILQQFGLTLSFRYSVEFDRSTFNREAGELLEEKSQHPTTSVTRMAFSILAAPGNIACFELELFSVFVSNNVSLCSVNCKYSHLASNQQDQYQDQRVLRHVATVRDCSLSLRVYHSLTSPDCVAQTNLCLSLRRVISFYIFSNLFNQITTKG